MILYATRGDIAADTYAHRTRLPYEPSYDLLQRAALKVQPHFKCFEPHALALKVPTQSYTEAHLR